MFSKGLFVFLTSIIMNTPPCLWPQMCQPGSLAPLCQSLSCVLSSLEAHCRLKGEVVEKASGDTAPSLSTGPLAEPEDVRPPRPTLKIRQPFP